MKILIMGLPGAGKTTLASELRYHLWEKGRTVSWFNADKIRKLHDDWDFSPEGRKRQSNRMKELADNSPCDYTICDFVAPLSESRDHFNADFIIWVDTITEGRFEDTNNIFEKPTKYNVRVTEQDAVKWAATISDML